MMSAADVIKKIRMNLYLERSEFAKLLNISTVSIFNYENGKRFPKLKIIKKIQDIATKNGMNYTIDDFLSN